MGQSSGGQKGRACREGPSSLTESRLNPGAVSSGLAISLGHVPRAQVTRGSGVSLHLAGQLRPNGELRRAVCCVVSSLALLLDSDCSDYLKEHEVLLCH